MSTSRFAPIALLAAMLAAACGDGAAALSPAAPSATTSILAAQPGVPAAPGQGIDNRRDPNHVEMAGRVTGRDAAAQTLTIGGLPISVPPAAIIRDGNRLLTLAEIAVGWIVEIKGAVQAAGLVATQIEVEDEDDWLDEDLTDRDGFISGLTGTCPALTFTVRTTVVTTSETTRFRDVPCASLGEGLRVEVRGRRQLDRSIVATRIDLDD
jgi:hypothetical protein